MRTNDIPAIVEIVFFFIFKAINFPKYTAMTDNTVRAEITPINTQMGLYFVANSPDAICVLSPISDTKMSKKADEKGCFSSQ